MKLHCLHFILCAWWLSVHGLDQSAPPSGLWSCGNQLSIRCFLHISRRFTGILDSFRSCRTIQREFGSWHSGHSCSTRIITAKETFVLIFWVSRARGPLQWPFKRKKQGKGIQKSPSPDATVCGSFRQWVHPYRSSNVTTCHASGVVFLSICSQLTNPYPKDVFKFSFRAKV